VGAALPEDDHLGSKQEVCLFAHAVVVAILLTAPKPIVPDEERRPVHPREGLVLPLSAIAVGGGRSQPTRWALSLLIE